MIVVKLKLRLAQDYDVTTIGLETSLSLSGNFLNKPFRLSGSLYFSSKNFLGVTENNHEFGFKRISEKGHW